MSSMIRLLDRPVAFHRPLVEVTGSVKAALMLSQLLYWWHRRTGETVYKTRDEWWEETGLSKDEQRTAEKTLVERGIISIKLIGSPPKNHYHLNVERLEELLRELPDRKSVNKQSTVGNPKPCVSEQLETPTVNRREPRQSTVGNPDPSPYTYTTTETTTESTRARKRAASFTPPTVSEIRAYCNERGSPIDPEAFHDFYSSKGWMVGKNKMKDWKAAVRTWERREREQANGVSLFPEDHPASKLSRQGQAVIKQVLERRVKHAR